jgi:hypothetical protein
VNVFLDTSVLVAGLIDLGPQSTPAHLLMHAVADGAIRGFASPCSPWLSARAAS